MDAVACGCKYGKNATSHGYLMSMFPEEIEGLCKVLQEHQPFKNSLEIGIAAGGTCRFIRENVDIKRTVTVDDGMRLEYKRLQGNLKDLKGEFVEIVGNTKNVRIKKKIKENGPYDLVGIDGGHTYEEVSGDFKHASSGSIVWFHDVNAVADVRKFWNEVSPHHKILMPPTGFIGMGVLWLS